LIGIAVGAPLGWWLHPDATQPLAHANSPQPVLASTDGNAGAVAHCDCSATFRLPETTGDLLSSTAQSASAADGVAPADDAIEALLVRAEADSALRHELFDDFLAEQDQDTRGSLVSVIAAIKSQDIQARVLGLLASGIPDDQLAALDMMQYWATSNTEAQHLIEQVLHADANPEVLRKALVLLNSEQLSDYQTGALQPRLLALATHPVAEVRATALAKLAEGQAYQPGLESPLLQGIQDPSDVVKISAIYALAKSQIRSDSVRQSLLALAEQTSASFAARSAAIGALTDFAITADEKRRIARAQSELDQAYYH
jgi:hypothetical protein